MRGFSKITTKRAQNEEVPAWMNFLQSLWSFKVQADYELQPHFIFKVDIFFPRIELFILSIGEISLGAALRAFRSNQRVKPCERPLKVGDLQTYRS